MGAILLWSKRVAFAGMLASVPVAAYSTVGTKVFERPDAVRLSPGTTVPQSPLVAASTAPSAIPGAQASLPHDKAPDPGNLLMAIIGIGIVAASLRGRPAFRRIPA